MVLKTSTYTSAEKTNKQSFFQQVSVALRRYSFDILRHSESHNCATDHILVLGATVSLRIEVLCLQLTLLALNLSFLDRAFRRQVSLSYSLPFLQTIKPFFQRLWKSYPIWFSHTANKPCSNMQFASALTRYVSLTSFLFVLFCFVFCFVLFCFALFCFVFLLSYSSSILVCAIYLYIVLFMSIVTRVVPCAFCLLVLCCNLS